MSRAEMFRDRHWSEADGLGRPQGGGGVSATSVEGSRPPAGSLRGARAMVSSLPFGAFFPGGAIQMFQNQPFKDGMRAPAG